MSISVRCKIIDHDKLSIRGDAELSVCNDSATIIHNGYWYPLRLELIRLAYHRKDTVVLQCANADWTLRMEDSAAAERLVRDWRVSSEARGL